MKLKRTITLHVRDSISPECFRGFFLIPLALVCFGLSRVPKAFGVSPQPDGGYPNFNTAEGYNALASLSSGFDNTANGDAALYRNTTAMDNTANGVNALSSNTTGNFNTANGASGAYHLNV